MIFDDLDSGGHTFLGAIVSQLSPVLVLLISGGFILYQVQEQKKLGDNAGEDVIEFLIGFCFGLYLEP